MANDILKFGENGTTSDLLTQAEYAADAQRLIGNQPGIARQKLVNKVLRQSAFISNAFAEYIISKVGGSILDDNDSAGLLAKITTAFTTVFTNYNYALNSNFDLWQRGTTVAVTVTNTYTADRFVNLLAGSTATFAKQDTTLTESFMARRFLRASVTSVAGVSNFNLLSQRMECLLRTANKTMTLTFWAKADSARNMSVELLQCFGTGGSPSADVNSIGVNKVALTTSWQKFTIIVSMPSISGKVLGTTDNTAYVGLNFWFDAGSTYNSRTSSLGQQSGTFDIAQIKFEEGNSATPYSYQGGSLAEEVSLCRRYTEKSYNLDVAPGTATAVGVYYFWCATAVSTAHWVVYMTQKRALATLTFYSSAGVAGQWIDSGSAARSINSSSSALMGFYMDATPGAINRYLQGHYFIDAEIY